MITKNLINKKLTNQTSIKNPLDALEKKALKQTEEEKTSSLPQIDKWKLILLEQFEEDEYNPSVISSLIRSYDKLEMGLYDVLDYLQWIGCPLEYSEIKELYDIHNKKKEKKFFESNKILWIEGLIIKGLTLDGGVKNAISMVLVPYFKNIQKLNYENSLKRYRFFIDKCELKDKPQIYNNIFKQSWLRLNNSEIKPMSLKNFYDKIGFKIKKEEEQK